MPATRATEIQRVQQRVPPPATHRRPLRLSSTAQTEIGKRTFVVPLHRELKRGTLRGILRDADLDPRNSGGSSDAPARARSAHPGGTCIVPQRAHWPRSMSAPNQRPLPQKRRPAAARRAASRPPESSTTTGVFAPPHVIAQTPRTRLSRCRSRFELGAPAACYSRTNVGVVDRRYERSSAGSVHGTVRAWNPAVELVAGRVLRLALDVRLRGLAWGDGKAGTSCCSNLPVVIETGGWCDHKLARPCVRRTRARASTRGRSFASTTAGLQARSLWRALRTPMHIRRTLGALRCQPVSRSACKYTTLPDARGS